MADCDWWDLLCHAGNAVSTVAESALENLASGVLDAFERSMVAVGTLWVFAPTPTLTGGGESAVAHGTVPYGADALAPVLGIVKWIGFAVAIMSLIAVSALAWVKAQRGEGVLAVGKAGIVLLAAVLVGAATGLTSALMPGRSFGAGGAVAFLQSATSYFTGIAVIASIIIGATRMAWTQRAEPGRDVVKSLLTFVVVSAAGVAIIAPMVTAADGFAVWILERSTSCSLADSGCFGASLISMMVIGGGTGAGVVGPILTIVLILFALLASLIQVLLMLVRGGMLVVLAGTLPVSASFTNTEMGMQWFRKHIGWLVAFILYKPVAAIVYATAIQLFISGVFQDEGSGIITTLTGLMMMLLALVALPALMKFVAPMTSAIGAGAGSGAGAAVAALPMGAMAAARTMGNSSGPSQAGPPGDAGSPGAEGSSASSGAPGASGSDGAASTSSTSTTTSSTDAGAPSSTPSASEGSPATSLATPVSSGVSGGSSSAGPSGAASHSGGGGGPAGPTAPGGSGDDVAASSSAAGAGAPLGAGTASAAAGGTSGTAATTAPGAASGVTGEPVSTAVLVGAQVVAKGAQTVASGAEQAASTATEGAPSHG
jgi:hypothetical protein